MCPPTCPRLSLSDAGQVWRHTGSWPGAHPQRKCVPLVFDSDERRTQYENGQYQQADCQIVRQSQPSFCLHLAELLKTLGAQAVIANRQTTQGTIFIRSLSYLLAVDGVR